jgi:hypothetical protein
MSSLKATYEKSKPVAMEKFSLKPFAKKEDSVAAAAIEPAG